MAIVVEHTPYGATSALATRAGEAQALQRQQEVHDKERLMQLQNQLQMKQMQFQEQAQQRARQEEMQYQSALIMAKRQVDIQAEAAHYARQKQNLMQTLDMIKGSTEFNEQEKEELRIQAMAKYSDVGTGISPSSFGSRGSSSMEDFLVKGAYRAQMGEQLQEQIDTGQITASEANRNAASFGLTANFKESSERRADRLAQAQKRLDAAQDAFTSNFKIDKKGRLTDIDDVEVKPGTPRFELAQTMGRQVEAMRREVESVFSETEDPEFDRRVKSDTNLQKAIELSGREAVYKVWKDSQTAAGRLEQESQDGSFADRHPVLGTLMRSSMPAYRFKEWMDKRD